MVAMVVMWTLWSFVLAKIAAPILGRLADTPAAPQVGESRHGA
jgi:hypothetical protein